MASLFNQMQTVKEKIKYLLIKNPHLRDDDFKLVSTYHYNEIGPQKVLKLSAMEFLHLYADGKLTHSASISRVRAKLQEQNPSLRGVKYEKRINEGFETGQKIKGL